MRFIRAYLLLALLPAASAMGQGLDLTVNHAGLAIGNVPRVAGLRLNFRDHDLDWVKGINATIWTSYDRPTGTVTGVALGLPLTDARRISGLAIGAAGVGASDELRGLGVAGLGLGAHRVVGAMVGGIGVGSGSSFHGIGVGGIGVGSGGDFRGLGVGGIGVGSGGRFTGIGLGGIGVGAADGFRGLGVGGIGIGTGGDFTGVGLGGIGIGAGGDLTGLAIGGIGAGAGGRLHGVAIGGIGAGAPRVEGILVGGFGAGAERATGALLAGAYTRIVDGRENGGTAGRMDGVLASPFNDVRGHMHGLSIGIINYARSLDGVQLGVLNIVNDNPAPFRVMPLINWHHK